MKKNTNVENNKMYLIGDIGNTDIKICLFNKNMKLMKIKRLKTVLLNKSYLSKNLKFIKRYKRFFSEHMLEDGTTVVAHCANTGAMMGINIEGITTWLLKNNNPKRKLKYTLEIIEINKKKSQVLEFCFHRCISIHVIIIKIHNKMK